MKDTTRRWAPVIVLVAGALLTVGGVKAQRTMDLRQPLDSAVPSSIEGLTAQEMGVSEEEQRVAGMTSYVARAYSQPGGATDSAADIGFTLYVGYYDQQTQGKTIHSPKNCLPGAGWEALNSRVAMVETDAGPVSVNRYLLQNKNRRALVLYWYQGRGRIAANEYVVKWNLLRDAALRRRSDEALVRIVVPIGSGGESEASALAARVARTVVPAVRAALPG